MDRAKGLGGSRSDNIGARFGEYSQFLRSLDDSELIDHINSLEDTRSDPFDDGLDEVLANLPSHSVTAKEGAGRTEAIDSGSAVEPGMFEEPRDGTGVGGYLHSIVASGPPGTSGGTSGARVAGANEPNAGPSGPNSGPNAGPNAGPTIGLPARRLPSALDEIAADADDTAIDASATAIDASANTVAADEIASAELSQDDSFAAVGPAHQFGDYHTYFTNKHLKQQQSDERYVKWDMKMRHTLGIAPDISPKKPIFEGCIIYVNGHTRPPVSEIHRLVILHGGKFLSYLVNKGAATHIICDRLTPKKKIEFRNYKVVKAQWITDCVAKSELLNWRDYLIVDDIEYGQKRLNFGLPVPNNSDSSEGEEPGAEDVDIEEEEVSDIEGDLTQPELEEEQLNQSQSRIQFFENQEVRPGKESKILDAKHPDFLKHFFANSRLHHLSTWKSDLRSKFLKQIVNKKRENPVNQTRHLQDHDKIIMHVDFDCFFATASSLNYPQYDILKQPLAVSHGGRSSDVASCNYVARKFGVSNGMWFGSAKKRCPDLIALDYDFDAYERYSSAFYNYLISCNKFDSIFPVSIDEALLDATSFCYSQDKDITQVVQELSQEIRSTIHKLTHCTVSVGTAKNVLLAKLAIKRAKPNGQFYLHEKVDEYLRDVPVRNLPGIGHSIKDKLQSALPGSSSKEPKIKDLLSFSETRLVNIFGAKTGAKLYQFARGRDETSIELDLNNSEAVLGRKSVSVDVNFGIRFDTVIQLETFLIELSKELYSRMVNLGICGSSLSIKLAKRAPDAPVEPAKYLGMGSCDFFSKSSRLGTPTNDWGVIGSELKALYRMLNIPVKELRGVCITMTKLEDVVNINRKRQMKLSFQNHRKERKLEPARQQAPQFISNPHNDLDHNNIDWEVFNQLPADLQAELKRELLRRRVTKVNSPSPSSRNSPSKKSASPESKAYMQQLLPLPDGSLEYRRERGSPVRASPSKKRRTTPLSLPVKKERIVIPSDISTPYDESMINELPSSIKKEILKDLEFKKKMKNFDMSSMRSKFNRKKEEKLVDVEISSEWLRQQRLLVEPPKFLGRISNYQEVRSQVKGWLQMSFDQEGPHIDDVKIFTDYLQALLYQQNLNRCLNLLQVIETELDCHDRKLRMKGIESQTHLIAIKDWHSHINSELKPLILDYCQRNNIDANL